METVKDLGSVKEAALSIVDRLTKEINDAIENNRIDHYESTEGKKRKVPTKTLSIFYTDRDGVEKHFSIETKTYNKQGGNNG